VCPDDPVEAPAAQLLTASGETHDYRTGSLLDCGEQTRESIAQGTAERAVVKLRVGGALFQKHSHTMRMAKGDLFDELLVSVCLIDDGEDFTHGSELPPHQLNGD
jgi:hypothetical protein